MTNLNLYAILVAWRVWVDSKLKDIIWLAGFLEGEGCFKFSNSLPVIYVSSVDEDVIKRVSLIVKKPYYKFEPSIYGTAKKPAYRLNICGTDAFGWMFTLYSLLGKRRKARIRELILNYIDRKAVYGNVVCKFHGVIKREDCYSTEKGTKVIRFCKICFDTKGEKNGTYN